MNTDRGLLNALEQLGRIADPPEARAWKGPRNLPKPSARKRRRQMQKASRKANR
jgi:hypothetical protein